MGRRFAWLLLAVVLVGACGDKPGAYIEIHGSKSLAKVAVYIGKEACTDPNGGACAVAPPTLARLRADTPGGTWFRDADTPFTAGASGGVARVHVEASGPKESVQLVVFGLDSSDMPVQAAIVHDVDVPSGGTTNLSVTLDDAMPVTSTEEGQSPHPDGAYALTWTSAMAPTDCVLVERWEGGVAQRTFIVPADDADCDGFPALDAQGNRNPLECDPYFFDFSSKMATSGNPSCALPQVVTGNLHSCVLGAQGCTDGTGGTGTCAQLPAPETCLSDAICTSTCAEPNNTGSFYGCATNNVGTTAGVVMRCYIFAQADSGLPCPQGNILAPTSGSISADGLFAGSTHICKDISFAPSDMLYGNQFTGMKLFAPAPSTTEIDLIDRTTTSTICTFDAQWKTGNFVPSTSPQHAIADIRVDDDRHMIVPVVLNYAQCIQATAGTELGFSCYVGTQGTDLITQCAM